jgi:hypothetical protein
MAEHTKSVACVRDWRDFTLDYYRLPSDGRKWRAAASNRRQLLEYLATFADGDGSNVQVGVERMEDKFQPISRATIFRLLDDLRELRALAPKSGLTSRYGTAVRSLTLEAFAARYEQELERQYQRFKESQIDSQGVSDSGVKESQIRSKESQVQVKESQVRI